MITSRSAISKVIGVILNSPLHTAINGVVARRRPANSEKEDVIVSALPITFGQMQRGVISVNIHVPNLSVTQGEVVDTAYPNNPRLEQLTELAIPILKSHIGDGFYFQVQSEQVIEEEKSSFANIRLSVQAKNI